MSEKKRINQIAKETGLSNAELVATAQALGFEVKAHSSSVTTEQAEQIVARAKAGGAAPATDKAVSADKAKKGTAKADKKSSDSPRTFAGKAIVVDPAILARIKAKEEAEKASKAKEHVVAADKSERVTEKATLAPKAEVKVEKPQTEVKSVAPKAEVKTETVTEKKETVITDEKKKPLNQKPRIQIKVVKRAEDIKKEQAAARPEKKKFDKNRNDRNNRNDKRRPNQGGQGGNRFDKNRPAGQSQGQGPKRDKFGATSAPSTSSSTPMFWRPASSPWGLPSSLRAACGTPCPRTPMSAEWRYTPTLISPRERSSCT